MGIEDQLNAFKAGLPEEKVTRVLPGFLFRDGSDRKLVFPIRRLNEIDEGLLEYQTGIYREALEVRNQILENIRPHEIIDMVKDIWRAWGSETEYTSEGASVTYHYPKVAQEWRTSYTTKQNSAYPPDSWTETSTSKTGKWYVNWLSAKQAVGVRFGNAEFPDHLSLQVAQLDEFFADRWRGIPRTIWNRPDNIGIYTSNYTSGLNDTMWFGRHVSQQEIKDSLWQKLAAQEAQGQLPYQISELEYAKINELRRRGLFIESKR